MFLHLLEPGDDVIPLACAAPDTPPPEVAEAYARVATALARIAGDIGYYPAGHPALRRAIADRYTGHGVRTGPEHILGQHRRPAGAVAAHPRAAGPGRPGARGRTHLPGRA